MRLRQDESALSELAILLLVVLVIIVVVAVIAGGAVLVVGLFFGGRIGAGLFFFVMAGLVLLAWKFAVKQQAALYLAYILIAVGLVFVILGALGK